MKYSISFIKSSYFHAFVHLSWHVIKVSQYMMLTIRVYTYIEKIYHVKSYIFCLFIDRGASMRCSFGFWELPGACFVWQLHYDDVIMGAMASQIAGLGLFTQPFIQGADQRNISFASLAFVGEIHRWPVNSPHGPVTRKMVPFDDFTMHYGLDDATWRHRTRSILAKVVSCCITAPSQCWFII